MFLTAAAGRVILNFFARDCRCGTREYPRFDPACARHKELVR